MNKETQTKAWNY